MNSKLLEIIEHYGVLKQLKQFHSEVYELVEASIQKEEAQFNRFKGYRTNDDINELKKYIAEEIADCYVMLEQFRLYYSISTHELKDIMDYKIERQLRRIEDEK